MGAAIVCCLLALEMASGLHKLPGAPSCSDVLLSAVLHARQFSDQDGQRETLLPFLNLVTAIFHAMLCIYCVSTLVLFEWPRGCVLGSWTLAVMSRTPFLISRA